MPVKNVNISTVPSRSGYTFSSANKVKKIKPKSLAKLQRCSNDDCFENSEWVVQDESRSPFVRMINQPVALHVATSGTPMKQVLKSSPLEPCWCLSCTELYRAKQTPREQVENCYSDRTFSNWIRKNSRLKSPRAQHAGLPLWMRCCRLPLCHM